MDERPIILDACCVLTLYATGSFAHILQLLPPAFHVGQRARGEAQWIRDDGPNERQTVDLAPALESGDLVMDTLDVRAALLFTSLAAFMEDGEAEAASLAIERGYALATDERKVHRILGEMHPCIPIYSTPGLLREWQMNSSIPDSEMSELLRRVAYGATFQPRRSDPLRRWWLDLAGR